MPFEHYRQALTPGARLYWYEIVRVLGQGGFGITYFARDTNLDQPVAIKEYLPVDVARRGEHSEVEPRSADEGELYRRGMARFLTEARTLNRFDHPNIVRVYSVFEANNTAYMVMRYEDGEALNVILDRARILPQSQLLQIVQPLLEGLGQIHAAGFIHRDVQPANIYLRHDGSPVLLDFGAARESSTKARTMTILVAPGYAPIEQYYAHGQEQGPWTDIYGLGATLYRAVAGFPPIDAIERSRGILGSTRDVMVPATVAGQGGYSEPFLRAIDHALQFNEKDRPQSAADWAHELESVQRAPDIAGKVPATAPMQAAAKAVDPAPQADARHNATSAVVRARWRPLAVALVVLGVAGAGLLSAKVGFFESLIGTDAGTSVAITRAPAAPSQSRHPSTAEASANFHAESARIAALERQIRELQEERRNAEHSAATAEPVLSSTAVAASPSAGAPAPPSVGPSRAAVTTPSPTPRDTAAPASAAPRSAEQPRDQAEEIELTATRAGNVLAAKPPVDSHPAAAPTRPAADPATQRVDAKPIAAAPVSIAHAKQDPLIAAPPVAPSTAATAQQTRSVAPPNPVEEAQKLAENGDYAGARTALEAAAGRGDAQAQYLFGNLLRDGRGGDADASAALAWYLKAAHQGIRDAQVAVARTYAPSDGAGVQEPFLAYTWFVIAEQNGAFDVATERDQVSRLLQPEQLPQAVALARALRANFATK